MTLPKQYQFLQSEGAPKMLVAGLNFYGIREVVGKQHNPVIMQWAKDVGLEKSYTADEIPWCGLVHAKLCQLSGKPIVDGPLWALNWAKWGVKVDTPMLGDTVTFKRPGGGHVGLYIGEDKTAYHVMGGNQGNAYGFTRIEKHRLYSATRLYEIAAPPNIRRIILDANGPVSVNEA